MYYHMDVTLTFVMTFCQGQKETDIGILPCFRGVYDLGIAIQN